MTQFVSRRVMIPAPAFCMPKLHHTHKTMSSHEHVETWHSFRQLKIIGATRPFKIMKPQIQSYPDLPLLFFKCKSFWGRLSPSFFFFFWMFVYFWLCWVFAAALSSCGEWGYCLVEVHELLTVVAFLLQSTVSRHTGFSSHDTWTQ